MKKIMKRLLSFVLALVMVVTLAPISAKAAAGQAGEEVTLPNVNGETITVTLNDTNEMYYYKWVATDSGVLTVGFTNTANGCSITNSTDSKTLVDSLSKKTYQAAIDKGDTYIIGVKSTTSKTLKFTTTFEKGAVLAGSTAETAIELTKASSTVSHIVGEKVYYKYVGNNTGYKVKFSDTQARNGFTVYTKERNSSAYTVENAIDAFGASIDFTSTDGTIIFAVENTAKISLNVKIVVSKTGDTIADAPEETVISGTQDNPEVISSLGTVTCADCYNEAHWYKWTSNKAGVLTISVPASSTDVAVSVYTVNGETVRTVTTSTSAAVQVAKNDIVIYYVRSFDPDVTSLKVTTAVEEGAILPEQEEESTFDDGEKNFEKSATAIVVGNNKLAASSSYPYTVYEFAPGAIGKYTFTTSDSKIGIVSNTGMWVDVGNPGEAYDPNMVPTQVVVENEIVWECTDAQQKIWIAVKADTNEANINVSKEELVIVEIPEKAYKATAHPYLFTGDANALVYVDVEDKKEDKAVLGKDGFYHLNEADGPILLVKLNDELLNLSKATETGKIAIVVYDKDGAIDYIYNCNDAIDAYVANMDAANGLYPLTEELMYIYQNYGEQQKWYTNFLASSIDFKYPDSEGWMFACMYVEEDMVPPIAIKKDVAKDNVISKKDLAEAIKTAKKEKRPLVIETTVEGFYMTIEVDDLEDASAVALNIKVALNQNIEDKAVAAVKEITEDNFVLKVEFEHSGKLPGKTAMTIPVPADYQEGTELFYYEILEDGTLKFVDSGIVDANGKVTVTQDHCSDYVLLTEDLRTEEELAEDLEESPKSGDSTNAILWMSILGLGVVAIAGSVVMKKRTI